MLPGERQYANDEETQPGQNVGERAANTFAFANTRGNAEPEPERRPDQHEQAAQEAQAIARIRWRCNRGHGSLRGGWGRGQ